MEERPSKPVVLASPALKGPRGLRVFNNRLYIADRSARVCFETSADLTDVALSVIPATAVKIVDYFREPYFIFPGPNGDLYGTEHLNGCIFLLSGPEPLVRAGKPGYGHGGTTTSTARFMNPRGGAFDPKTGTLWIADHANDQLRLIEMNDAVSTLGNGRSSSLEGNFENCGFRRPSDICYYNDGIFFVACAYSIVKVDSKAETVSTLTGNPNEGGNVDGPPGTAMLGVLTSIAISGDHIFVTDVDAGKIRVIDMFGLVSTLEMPKTEELFGIAITPHGHALYTSQRSPTVEMIPFVMDDLLVQPITMEILDEFDGLSQHEVAGQNFPLPILQLAYPQLLTASKDAYNDLTSDPALVKVFTSYLLTNNDRQMLSSPYSPFIIKTLTELGIPASSKTGAVRAAATHLQRHLSALYHQVVHKDAAVRSNVGEIQLSEEVVKQMECNFTIVSSAGTAFPCHDWVLYGRWPFFRHMVNTGLFEKTSKRAELDELQDQTLCSLLKFFYTNEWEDFRTPHIAIDLLTHAQRFNLATMDTPPKPTEPAFQQLLARCRQAFDTTPVSQLPNILSVAIEYATPSQLQRINRLLAGDGT